MVSFVAMADVSETGVIDNFELRKASSGYTPFAVGDVLVAKITPCFENGKGALVQELPTRCGLGSTEFHVLRARPYTSERYLYHLTRTAQFRARGEGLMSGSAGQRRVPTEFFSRYAVRLPPLEEQRRIAEILDTIDETIQATDRVIAKRKVVRAGLASELLDEWRGGECPVNWKPSDTLPRPASASAARGLVMGEVFLRDCGRWLSGGTPDTGNPNYWGGEIPWITASSLKGRYLSTSKRRLTRAGVEAGSRMVPPQTILFVVRGMSLKKEFRVGMAVRPVAFGQDCKALSPAYGIDPKYLLFALEAAENRVLRLVDEASHGTGRLPTPLLGRLKLRLPPLEEQRRIAEVIDVADDTVQTNEEKRDKLRQLRSGLAADLLSGRVRTVAA